MKKRKERRERILVVEPDPEIADLVARQSLAPLGYKVKVVGEAGAAFVESARFAPHLIIADLALDGLSGKDLIMAFRSRGSEVPIIAIGQRGKETDIIQAFRLGAADYLLWPMREAEVVAAVERVLAQVRERQTNKRLTLELQRTNEELQKRVRELTTLFDLAKTVASSTNQSLLLQRLLEGSIQVTNADKGWMFLVDENTRKLVLGAQKGMPASLAARVGKVWDDGLSSLVMLSGEPLNIYGDPLKRFKIYRLGRAALVVPVKAKNRVIAVMVVTRDIPKPFTSNEQALLEAIGDYAAVALVNARLFKALEDRAKQMREVADSAVANERAKELALKRVANEVGVSLKVVTEQIEALLNGELGDLTPKQRRALQKARSEITRLSKILGEVRS